jgi:hypothetical protein
MTIGALVGLAASAVAVGVISGISILGSGLNTASVKIIFGMATLINILFKVDLGMGAEKGGSFQIGLGLASNIVSVFSPTELWGVGWIIATAIGIVAFVCGMLTLSGGATL